MYSLTCCIYVIAPYFIAN
uniref:Uncharacterized protein n=1 Tax=Anguilla anguilla TaxID=7936 RepID=A0A0E9VRP9_ANGAN